MIIPSILANIKYHRQCLRSTIYSYTETNTAGKITSVYYILLTIFYNSTLLDHTVWLEEDEVATTFMCKEHLHIQIKQDASTRLNHTGEEEKSCCLCCSILLFRTNIEYDQYVIHLEMYDVVVILILYSLAYIVTLQDSVMD